METQFTDRVLTCSDCRNEFVFTAGEQLFFHEKQFKNDPKRCKPCKSRRSGVQGTAKGDDATAAGLSRTETRTLCSECGVETTVPFRPTQGRPVLCRQCFQNRNRAAAAAKSLPAMPAGAPVHDAGLTQMPAMASAATSEDVVQALTAASRNHQGEGLSAEAAAQAAASMEAASEHSSVASLADLKMISGLAHGVQEPAAVPVELIASGPEPEAELVQAMAESLDG